MGIVFSGPSTGFNSLLELGALSLNDVGFVCSYGRRTGVLRAMNSPSVGSL